MPKKNTGPRVKWRKDRDCWEVTEYKNNKRYRYATGFTSREDAEKWLAEYIVTSYTPQTGPSHPTKRLIADVLTDYVLEKGQHLSSKKTLSYAIEELNLFWGENTIDAINNATCNAYYEHRDKLYKKRQKQKGIKSRYIKQISNGMVRRELVVLSAALNHDFKSGRVTSVPHVWKPSDNNAKERFLSRSEAALLLKSSNQLHEHQTKRNMRAFIMLGLYTGARKTAILNLKWNQVDFKNGWIDFRPSNISKSNKKYPRIPMHRKLRLTLKQIKKYGHDFGHIIHYRQKPISDIKTSFKKTARIAGFEDVTPYTLRHTAASWMVQKGVPPYKVAAYLGNSPEMIIKHYGHLAPEHMRDALNALG